MYVLPKRDGLTPQKWAPTPNAQNNNMSSPREQPSIYTGFLETYFNWTWEIENLLLLFSPNCEAATTQIFTDFRTTFCCKNTPTLFFPDVKENSRDWQIHYTYRFYICGVLSIAIFDIHFTYVCLKGRRIGFWHRESIYIGSVGNGKFFFVINSQLYSSQIF